ncbi:UNVERIFIED_CONTAM: hypothetical protein FKN15_064323 [Acipenser sinensis]
MGLVSRLVAFKTGSVEYLSRCWYGNGAGTTTLPQLGVNLGLHGGEARLPIGVGGLGGLGPGPGDGGTERGGGARLLRCAGAQPLCHTWCQTRDMDHNTLAELLEALESRRDTEERRREERYTALIERVKYLAQGYSSSVPQIGLNPRPTGQESRALTATPHCCRDPLGMVQGVPKIPRDMLQGGCGVVV